MKKIVSTLIGIVIGFIIFGIIDYVLLLPLRWNFQGFYILLIVIAASVFVINGTSDLKSWKTKKLSVMTVSIAVIVLAVVIPIVIGFYGNRIFHSQRYRNMIGTIKEEKFSDKIAEVDMSQLPTIDMELARNLADKKLGSEVALGSVATIGEGTLQNVNKKLMYVFPLEHNGFFKYITKTEGTNGYITVSATDAGDVNLVKSIHGKKVMIQYQNNAYFSRNLKRHVYLHASKMYGYTDYTFELDDNGNPYWTVTIYKNSCGFGAQKVVGLLTVDANSGNIKKYDINHIPEWVDRVYPKQFIKTQLSDWGEYVHGIFNFSNKGKLKATQGEAYLYNKGNCYLYTGITSVGSDDSTVGFVLTDLRTHKAVLYKVGGATELAGKSSMEGKVQEKGYIADFPYLINIEGNPTYFSPLKDKKGLVKMYAFCSVKDYSIVGVGETLSQAKSSYIKALQEQGEALNVDTDKDLIHLTGTIDRIGSSTSDGYTNFYMILKEAPDIIFIGNDSISKEIPVSQPGDRVTIEYNKTTHSYADIRTFDNEQYTQQNDVQDKEDGK